MKTTPAATVAALLLATADHIETHGLLLGMFQFHPTATGEDSTPVCGCLLGTMRHHAGLPPPAATATPGHPVMAPALKALDAVTLAERRELGGDDGPVGLMAWSDHHADLVAFTYDDKLAGVRHRDPHNKDGGPPHGDRLKVISALRRTAHSEIAKNLH
ncbi:MAG: hypothetical protein OXK74_02115 [Gemmatimonadota bacterium]|nr:hypothetical protein [Gemmatimonadota bacterium]